MTKIELKYYPIQEIWRMYEDHIIDNYTLLDLTLYNCNLFVQLILDLPYILSENQALILETYADPINNYRELLLCCGRNSAKSDLAAIIALWEIYKILHKQPTPQTYYHFNKKIYALIVATAREQAQDITYSAIDRLVEGSPWLKQYVQHKTKEEIHFIHDVIVKTQTCSSTASRGYGTIVLIFDEHAHFLDLKTGKRSGEEVYYALKENLKKLIDPTTGIPAGKLVSLSTPAGRQGIFWDLFKKGKPIKVIENTPEHGEELYRAVFQLATWEMNTNLPQNHPDTVAAYNQNKDKARQEIGAEFCDVVEAALSRELVLLCAGGTPENGYRQIGETVEDKTTPRVIMLDPALTGDAYALAMGHKEKCEIHKKDCVIIDLAQRWTAKSINEPINPHEVENRIRNLANRFKITHIGIDQYQSASTIRSLSNEGLPIYKLPPQGVSAQKYNQVAYEATIRRINTLTIHLPWHATLINELTFLQRKQTGQNIRYEAAQGSSDDMADTIARAVITLETETPRIPHISGGH